MAYGKASLTRMTLPQLLKLRDEIVAAIGRKVAVERRELEDRIQELGGLVSSRQAGRPRGRPPRASQRGNGRTVARGPRRGSKVKPKYRGPQGETWSGRGLPPRWLSALEKAGKKRESFLIK